MTRLHPLRTRLGRALQKEWRGASEVLSPFFTDDPQSDPADWIATELDLDTVKRSWIVRTRQEMLKATQESLLRRGLPDVLTVWRCGARDEHRGRGDVTSVTLRRQTAERGCRAGYYGGGAGEVRRYRVRREDVLADVSALLRTELDEEELLVRPQDLVAVDMTPNESISESESAESRRFVADWLRQVPTFMAELGIEDRPDLAETLEYLGSGGRADVVFLGERDGIKRVLKITNDRTQATLSQAAMEDEPIGIVPIYEVVATEVEGRVPGYPTWGVIERFVVPLDALYSFPDTARVADIPVREATSRFMKAKRLALGSARAQDPEVEEWRLDYAAALEWVEEVCGQLGVDTLFDLHEGNWGVDPETGELLLIDLGQCFEPPMETTP